MKILSTICIIILGCVPLRAQTIDSIFFNLYTDSLKLGVYNYINMDARMSNGKYRPMTAKEIDFTASAGRFEGNSLIIDSSYRGDSIRVTGALKSNPAVRREIIIYIKKGRNSGEVKSLEEVLGNDPPKRKSRRRRN